MKIIFTILILMSSPYAHAYNCDEVFSITNSEKANINARNQRIGLLSSLVAKSTDTLNRDLYPRYKDAAHAVSIYDFQNQEEARIAISEAILVVQKTIVANRAVKNALNLLSHKIQAAPGQSLANQIRALLTTAKMSDDTKMRLDQIANEIELFESHPEDWQTSEQEILDSCLSGGSVTNLLLDKLVSLNERIKVKIEQLKDAKSHDENVFHDLETAIFDVNFKMSGYLGEIANLQNDNAASSARIKSVKPKLDFCNRPQLQDIVGGGLPNH